MAIAGDVALSLVGAERIVVELNEGGEFLIEYRSVSSVELLNRLQRLLKDEPNREVHVIPAKKLNGGRFRQLVSLVRTAGCNRVTWPDWVSIGERTSPSQRSCQDRPFPATLLVPGRKRLVIGMAYLRGTEEARSCDLECRRFNVMGNLAQTFGKDG